MIIAASVALIAFPMANSALQWRQTNGDLVAAQVSQNAAPRNLIVVHPWYNALTFARYYRGTAPWTTLPPLQDYRFYRYDLLKSKLQTTNAIASVLEETEATLQSGHRVWFVGQLPGPQPDGSPPPDLPPGSQWAIGLGRCALYDNLGRSIQIFSHSTYYQCHDARRSHGQSCQSAGKHGADCRPWMALPGADKFALNHKRVPHNWRTISGNKQSAQTALE